jgi:MFS-type transporter involved in bile tolerance (Atg22 family)
MAHGATTRTKPAVALPPEKLRWVKLLYAGIFMCFLFSHIDVGILSQSNDKAVEDLEINESKMGLLETGLYVGIVAGTIICPVLF